MCSMGCAESLIHHYDVTDTICARIHYDLTVATQRRNVNQATINQGVRQMDKLIYSKDKPN